jgi:hypothetical protein
MREDKQKIEKNKANRFLIYTFLFFSWLAALGLTAIIIKENISLKNLCDKYWGIHLNRLGECILDWKIYTNATLNLYNTQQKRNEKREKLLREIDKN